MQRPVDTIKDEKEECFQGAHLCKQAHADLQYLHISGDLILIDFVTY